jgi:hypothetical protein
MNALGASDADRHHPPRVDRVDRVDRHHRPHDQCGYIEYTARWQTLVCRG